MPNSWIKAKAFSLPRFRSDTQKLALCVSAVNGPYLVPNMSSVLCSIFTVECEGRGNNFFVVFFW